MTVTLFRLAFAGIRSRLLAAVLTTVIAAAASATLVIALEVRASGVDPWQRTFDAAHGAHVLALVPSLADARAVAARPGIAERDDPVPLTLAQVAIGHRGEPMDLAGLGGRPTINAPVRTEGTAQPGSGIVLERSFADALHIPVGATIRVSTPTGPLRLTVVGTAVSPSQARYPRSNPGFGWVSRDNLQRIQPDRHRWSWTQPVRLADPAAAPAFAAAAEAALPPSPDGGVVVFSWQDQREAALLDSQPITIIVGMFTILLLAVVFAVVTILTAARVSAQYREIGLLKAIGLTPRQVRSVFRYETLVLGLVAVAAGFPVGAVLAPRIAASSAQTLLSAPTVAASPWHALAAGCVILPILLFSTALAARRATRSSTLGALRAGAPAAAARTARIARVGHPLPATLGLKDLMSRRRRTFWTAAAVVVTGAVLVTTLQMRAAIRPVAGKVSDVPAELSTMVYSLDAVLVLISATTLMAVMLLSVRERIRDLGVLKAIGLTPAQITASLVSAQALLGAVAALVSVPLGIGLYLAVLGMTSGTTQHAVLAPWWQIALVPLGVAVAAAATTTGPARFATQLPVTAAVRYE